MNLIYSFQPYLKPVVWGGKKIGILKQIPGLPDKIGESWEISGVPGHESIVAEGEDAGSSLPQLIDKYKGSLLGERVYQRYGSSFPLLIKLIDACGDLSIQVHPDDKLAMERHHCPGKTEMWYVVDAEPKAKILAGFSRKITKEEYFQRIAEHSITDVLACHKSHRGDVFFLPAGRIHAIGQGNLIAEIQQTSDITYRVYDYGRLDADGKERELHTELAADAIDYNVFPNYTTDYPKAATGVVPLINCEYFNVKRLSFDIGLTLPPATDSFMAVVCIGGKCKLNVEREVPGQEEVQKETATLRQGTTVLIPASATAITFTGKAMLLTASL